MQRDGIVQSIHLSGKMLLLHREKTRIVGILHSCHGSPFQAYHLQIGHSSCPHRLGKLPLPLLCQMEVEILHPRAVGIPHILFHSFILLCNIHRKTAFIPTQRFVILLTSNLNIVSLRILLILGSSTLHHLLRTLTTLLLTHLSTHFIRKCLPTTRADVNVIVKNTAMNDHNFCSTSDPF